jgi:hypothetical protein
MCPTIVAGYFGSVTIGIECAFYSAFNFIVEAGPSAA